MIDEHLLYVWKNTTPQDRLMWLKRMRDFWIKMQYQKNLAAKTHHH